MKFFLCFVFMLFGFSALSMPLMERHRAFLEYEQKKQQFKNIQKETLNKRLKELKRVRMINQTPDANQSLANQPLDVNKMFLGRENMSKGFLDYENKQKQFDEIRKKAFAGYKKKYNKYQIRQQRILSARLKKIESIRNNPLKSP